MNRGEFPLHRAAAAEICDLKRMKHLLDMGIPIDSRDCRQNTPLHYASTKQAAEFLINNKCDLDARNSDGETALMRVFRNAGAGCLDVMIILIESGADVNCRDVNNWNALHFACYHSSLGFDFVRLFVNKVSDINAVTTGGGSKTPGGDSALSLAAFFGQKDIVDLLIQSGARVSCGHTFSHSLFYSAAYEGWTEIVKATVDEFDVNFAYAGETALMVAVRKRRYGVVDFLLKYGANIYLKDYNNHTAIFSALPDVDLIISLVNSGAYLEHCDYLKVYDNTLCRERILKNIDVCAQILINEYNNMCLPTVYQMYSPVKKLPLIKRLKIKNNRSVISEIKKSVGREIQMKTFCNVMEARPLVLQILAVRSLISNRF